MHRTGSDEKVNSVVGTIGPGGPGDETWSVADTPGDAIVMSSECWDIDRATLEIYVCGGSTTGRSRKCVVSLPTVSYLTRGCLPLICALRG